MLSEEGADELKRALNPVDGDAVVVAVSRVVASITNDLNLTPDGRRVRMVTKSIVERAQVGLGRRELPHLAEVAEPAFENAPDDDHRGYVVLGVEQASCLLQHVVVDG